MAKRLTLYILIGLAMGLLLGSAINFGVEQLRGFLTVLASGAGSMRRHPLRSC